MYKFGPEIEASTVRWLEDGAVFPEYLVLRTSTSGLSPERALRILDRDQDGVVRPLMTGRRGKKGFVLRVEDVNTEQQFAAKLCIPADYDHGPGPLSEVEFARKLRGGSDLVLLPVAVGTVDRFQSEPPTEDRRAWICYLSEWLTGVSLEELVRKSPDRLTPALVAKISKELLTAVMFLESNDLKHDDLTLGNMMLVDGNPALAAINPERGQPSLRVIDLGSAKPLSKTTQKADDDWTNVARCLAMLHNILHLNRSIASRNHEFLRRLSSFIEALSDEDRSRHFPSQTDYIRMIQEAEDTITMEPRPDHKFHPLDAISAEHLASDQLLLKLFVDHLPWISMVEEKGPIALIGPRGCGKSMVFRYLAARTHIHSKSVTADLLDRTGMFGVYIGCASDLGNDLIWLGRDKRDVEQNVDQIVDYFNLVAVRELMRSLASASGAPALAGRLGITTSAKMEAIAFIKESLGENIDIVCIGGMEPMQACADAMDRLRLKLSRSMRDGSALKLNTGSTFLRDLCRLLSSSMTGLQRYAITFLLDDYTAHRLSPLIQSVINTVAFQRDNSHVFKISSEPYGFDPTHFYGTRIDANREYVEVDAGELTLEQMSHHQRREFVTQLLDKRLSTAKFSGTTALLIGDSEHKEDPSLAEAIRDERKGKKNYYNGIHVLSNAWSGDVATILHMVRDMFANARVVENSVSRIPNSIQHEAIVRVSKGLRGRVSGFHPYGSAMSSIMTSFGDLAQKLLVECQGKARDGTNFAHRKYRIEMTLPEGVDLESELLRIRPDGELVALYRELVRRAIFHELTPSRGKESAGRRTVRLQIRASLLPSFGTSLVRHNHLNIHRVEDFAEFLTEPKRWAEAMLSRFQMSGGLFNELAPLEDA